MRPRAGQGKARNLEEMVFWRKVDRLNIIIIIIVLRIIIFVSTIEYCNIVFVCTLVGQVRCIFIRVASVPT